MTTGIPADELKWLRHSARMALVRALLALAYLAAEAFLSASGLTTASTVVIGLFVAYSLFLFFYHSHSFVRTFGLFILFLDLVFLLSLVFWGTTGLAVALAGIFYVFLVLESWARQGAHEVILIATAMTLVVYSARAQSGHTGPFLVTVQSVLFLLLVASLGAFLFSDERYLVARRIMALANNTKSASEPGMVASMQAALEELARWFRCSHALLAFWDDRHDYFFLCRYPPAAEPARATSELEDSREWSVFRGERLDFFTNDVNATKDSTPNQDREFDLHAHLIGKFQIYNAVGCALHHEGKIIGRLLLINRVSPMRAYLLRRLKRVAPAFTKLVLHVLVIKAVEHAAYERERFRVAQDFHDGPLQSVISFQMRVHLIRKLLERDPAAAAQELEQLQDLARKQVTEIRTFVNSMRPVEVDTASLTAAARRLVDDFQKESGVPVTFVSSGEPVSTPGKIGMDVLQIIREALHNIQKHAQATHVLFSLEKNDNQLMIAVNDNGKGFRFGGRYSLEELEQLRLGPNSIKQRMRALGGDVLLESQPGHGTSLRLKIPLY